MTKGECSTRAVEIEEPDDLAATVLRKAFERRAGAVASLRGKRKVLSPDEAAVVIERTFRAYLIRRSKSLRALRELAVAKSKLKELRALFNSHKQSIARDSEERQRFSEQIISLILAVDAIQGTDIMVRGGRRSMLDELEAMLDAIDPHPTGKLHAV
ncbi:BCL-2-associated athanogene 7 [Hibiscus trionum]|uniref:BCL-2-associated athanogene 7 n=1 Tax=Hibiscus trionum TaxID=183268 RepID=A0A9W7IM26_HIBTR|nr:BCL-2-associated athanogene 7 [Hibiscus trionum]